VREGSESEQWGEGWERDGEGRPYPGVIEFGLDPDVFAFFLVLRAEDLEFGGFEGTMVDFRVTVWNFARGTCTFPHPRRLSVSISK
jgi:hypothetical protein